MPELIAQFTGKNKQDLDVLNAKFKTQVEQTIIRNRTLGLANFIERIERVQKQIDYSREQIRTKGPSDEHNQSKINNMQKNIRQDKGYIAQRLIPQFISYNTQVQQKINNNFLKYKSELEACERNANTERRPAHPLFKKGRQ